MKCFWNSWAGSDRNPIRGEKPKAVNTRVIQYVMGFTYLREKERGMEQLELLGEFLSGVGILLLGCAAMWFVTVYQEKKK